MYTTSRLNSSLLVGIYYGFSESKYLVGGELTLEDDRLRRLYLHVIGSEVVRPRRWPAATQNSYAWVSKTNAKKQGSSGEKYLRFSRPQRCSGGRCPACGGQHRDICRTD